MTTRLLPAVEWPRLAGTELDAVWPLLDPEVARIVVVEDADGSIAGCWALFPQWHVEGLYIAPAHRKRGAVARRLYQGMVQTARRVGARAVATGSLSADVTRLLGRVGAVKLPGEHFSMRVS